jgi:hypothetical protein
MEKQIIEFSIYAALAILFAIAYFSGKGGRGKGSKVLDPFIEKILNKIWARKSREMGLV